MPHFYSTHSTQASRSTAIKLEQNSSDEVGLAVCIERGSTHGDTRPVTRTGDSDELDQVVNTTAIQTIAYDLHCLRVRAIVTVACSMHDRSP